jgi:hypothetical protein
VTAVPIRDTGFYSASAGVCAVVVAARRGPWWLCCARVPRRRGQWWDRDVYQWATTFSCLGPPSLRWVCHF